MEEKKAAPVPEVQVAKVERKTITEKVIVYGSVVAQPGKTHSVSIAFETRVRHILVAPGQFVQKDDPLVEIELSPGAQVQFQQARNAAEAARKEFKQTQERFNLKLATNQELSAAEKTARDAEAQLTSLQRAGAGGDNRIHSDMSGVIAKVDAQDGQIVPPGGPLVEIVAENEIEVKLGVEAEDLSAAQEGAPITDCACERPNCGKSTGQNPPDHAPNRSGDATCRCLRRAARGDKAVTGWLRPRRNPAHRERHAGRAAVSRLA